MERCLILVDIPAGADHLRLDWRASMDSGIRIGGERHLVSFVKNLRRLRRQRVLGRGNQQANQPYGE